MSKIKLSIIGLGYVGYELFKSFKKHKDIDLRGYDISEKKINTDCNRTRG